MTVLDLKSSFSFIVFLNSNPMVGISQVKLKFNLASLKLYLSKTKDTNS